MISFKKLQLPFTMFIHKVSYVVVVSRRSMSLRSYVQYTLHPGFLKGLIYKESIQFPWSYFKIYHCYSSLYRMRQWLGKRRPNF